MTKLTLLGAGLTVGWSRGPRLIEFFAWDAATGQRLLAAAVTEKRRARLEVLFRRLAAALATASAKAERFDDLRSVLADVQKDDDPAPEETE